MKVRRLQGPLHVVTSDIRLILPLEQYPLCVKILWLSCVWYLLHRVKLVFPGGLCVQTILRWCSGLLTVFMYVALYGGCVVLKYVYLFGPLPPRVLCGLRGPPSWAWQEWDAHEARLRCSDGV